jgi:hypothetical protein
MKTWFLSMGRLDLDENSMRTSLSWREDKLLERSSYLYQFSSRLDSRTTRCVSMREHAACRTHRGSTAEAAHIKVRLQQKQDYMYLTARLARAAWHGMRLLMAAPVPNSEERAGNSGSSGRYSHLGHFLVDGIWHSSRALHRPGSRPGWWSMMCKRTADISLQKSVTGVSLQCKRSAGVCRWYPELSLLGKSCHRY